MDHVGLRAHGWLPILLAVLLGANGAMAVSVPWSRTFGDGRFTAAALAATEEGGLVVGGWLTSDSPTIADGWIMKLDGAGNALWQKRYHGDATSAFNVINSAPGGYIGAGSTTAGSSGHMEALVTRLSAEGDVVWQTRLGAGNAFRINDVHATLDDGYVAVGQCGAVFVADDFYEGCAVKLDGMGNVVWQRSYARDGTPTSSFLRVRPLPSGGFLLAGGIRAERTYVAEGNAWVVEVDAAGDILWEKSYGQGIENFRLADLRGTLDGGFVLVGNTYRVGQDWSYGWIARLGPRGDIAWQKSVGPLYRSTWMRAVQPAPDGTFMVVGETLATPVGGNSGDAVVWRLDAAGNVLWQRLLGGALRESFTSLAALPRGYAALGWTESFGTNAGDAWVVGLDPNGAFTDCIKQWWVTPIVRDADAVGTSGRAMVGTVPMTQSASFAVPSDTGPPVVWQQCPVAVPYTQLVALEYYHTVFDHYFVTTDQGEMSDIEYGEVTGWTRTANWFRAFGFDAGAAPMCRFWSGGAFAPKSSHFMTAFEFECEKVMRNPDWVYEGNAFATILPDAAGNCPATTIPLYRFYNDGQGGAPNHRYVTKGTDRAAMIIQHWIPEGAGAGVAGCVPPN